MSSQILKIDTLRLKALIEIRKDLKGNDYYLVTSSLGKLRFTLPSSLNDFLTHNDLGYVE